MKKIFPILMLMAGFFLFGCSEYQMKTYETNDRINFTATNDYGQETDRKDDLVYEKNFGTMPPAQLYDTVQIEVKVQGNITDYPRKVAFKVEPENSGIEVVFPEEYYVPADTFKAAFKVLVKRVELLDTLLEAQLTFDYARSDFQAGTEERQYYALTCYDVITIDLVNMSMVYWNYFYKKYLGTWSNVKARFIIRTLGVTDFLAWRPYLQSDAVILKKALEEYKSNPANPPLYDEMQLPEKVWISFD